MDMARKDYINFVMDEPALKYGLHTFTLHVMCFIAIVDWNVHKNNEPRGLLPVNPFKFFFEPHPLRCVLHCKIFFINLDVKYTDMRNVASALQREKSKACTHKNLASLGD